MIWTVGLTQDVTFTAMHTTGTRVHEGGNGVKGAQAAMFVSDLVRRLLGDGRAKT